MQLSLFIARLMQLISVINAYVAYYKNVNKLTLIEKTRHSQIKTVQDSDDILDQ